MKLNFDEHEVEELKQIENETESFPPRQVDDEGDEKLLSLGEFLNQIKNGFASIFKKKDEEDVSTLSFEDKYRKEKKKKRNRIIAGVLIGLTVIPVGFAAIGPLLNHKDTEKAKTTKQSEPLKDTKLQKALDDKDAETKKAEEVKVQEEAKKAQEEAKKADEAKKAEEDAKKDAESTSSSVDAQVKERVQAGLESATRSVVDEYNKKLEEAAKNAAEASRKAKEAEDEAARLREASRTQPTAPSAPQEAPKPVERLEIPSDRLEIPEN